VLFIIAQFTQTLYANHYLTLFMNNKQATGVALSKNEKELLDSYAEKFGLSRSAVIRFIINDFFLKNKEVNQ